MYCKLFSTFQAPPSGICLGVRVVEIMHAAGTGGQTPDVLEGASGMGARPALFIQHAGFGERQCGSAVHQPTLTGQRSMGGPHEAGFHLHRDHARVTRAAACGHGHGDIQQRHDRAAMGDAVGVEVLRLRRVKDFRPTIGTQGEHKAQMPDERNFNAKVGGGGGDGHGCQPCRAWPASRPSVKHESEISKNW